MRQSHTDIITFNRATPWRLVLGVVLVLALWGCSSGRSGPAPVETVNVKSTPKSTNKSRFQSRAKSRSNAKSAQVTYYQHITGNNHKIVKGDTLYSIAWRSGLDFRQIARLNKIRSPYQIFPGQTIVLRPKVVKSTKNKVRHSVPKITPIISPQNVAKTLATPKQGEYRQAKAQNKPTVKQKKKQNKPQSNKPTSTKKPYSNKIRNWVWPTSGRVIAGFSNKENGNKGIDITGKSGTSIVSAADGKVVYYGNALRGYGNLVIIKHNDDYLSAYAHNSRVLVKEQDFVKAGQQIAEMGNTDSPNVKLHFEVRYRGKSVNPMKYLSKR
jgi:lipoprotein NlpD